MKGESASLARLSIVLAMAALDPARRMRSNSSIGPPAADSRLRDAFTSVSILVNHVGPSTRSYPEGKRATARADWYAIQVEASRSLTVPKWLSILTGALDCHIEHHLFPELPPNRLREISAQVAAVCVRFGVTYRRHTWPRACVRRGSCSAV